MVAAFVVIAVGAPYFAPFDPIKTDYRAVRKAPSAAHRLGTDEVGRDVLSRLIWGARASLLAGAVPVTIALLVSLPLGLLSGCAGGWLDGLIMRVTDAMLAIPFLIVAIALAAFLGPSLINAMIAIGIAALPTFLRLARGTALALTTEEFVVSARALGCSRAAGRRAARPAQHAAAPAHPVEPHGGRGDHRRGEPVVPGAGPAAAGAVVGQHAQRRPALSRRRRPGSRSTPAS